MATQEMPGKPAPGFLTRTAPPELVLCILRSCESTRDLFALVSTCRYIYQVWQANVSKVLWSVWLHEIPHFQDAITAVSSIFPGSKSAPTRVLTWS